MRNLAITGIVLVLLVTVVGAGLTLRAAQSASASTGTTGTTAGQGGGPGLIPFVGRGVGNGGNAATGTTATQVTVVDQGDVTLTVNATGHVVSKQQTTLSFQQSGMVKAVNVQVGQKVKAGDVLATLDDSSQQTALAKATNGLKSAQAALDKLLQPVSKADIDSAETSVKSAMASYQSSANSGTSQAGMKAIELQYEQALKNVEAANYAVAGAGGQYSKDDPNYQKAVASVGQAQITADQAKLKLQQAQTSGADLSQETANIALAQAKLAQVKAGPSQSDLDGAQAQIEVAQVQLLQAQHNVALTKITAPFEGVVTEVDAKAGEVSSGTAFVLVDSSTLYVDINVDEAEIGTIKVGLPVALTVDALPEAQLTGKVQRISPLADTTSTSVITYTVRIMLESTDAPIKTGMTAAAVFTTNRVHNVIRVSNTYLKTNKTYNQTTVNLINRNGTTTVVPVTLGVQGTDYSEVIDGLRAGDRLSVTAITNVPTTTTGQ